MSKMNGKKKSDFGQTFKNAAVVGIGIRLILIMTGEATAISAASASAEGPLYGRVL